MRQSDFDQRTRCVLFSVPLAVDVTDMRTAAMAVQSKARGKVQKTTAAGDNALNQNGESEESAQSQLPLGPMGEICRTVLASLEVDTPRQLEDLVESLELCSSSEIIAALFELEMLGIVRQLPGKHFIKVWANS